MNPLGSTPLSGTSDLSPEENDGVVPPGAAPSALIPDPLSAVPRMSMATLYAANRNRRGADGRFNPVTFVRQVEKIGDAIRQARSESDATGSGG